MRIIILISFVLVFIIAIFTMPEQTPYEERNSGWRHTTCKRLNITVAEGLTKRDGVVKSSFYRVEGGQLIEKQITTIGTSCEHKFLTNEQFNAMLNDS